MLQDCEEFERAVLEVVLIDLEPFESITATTLAAAQSKWWNIRHDRPSEPLAAIVSR